MPSPVHWIEMPGPRRLAIMARPRAGDWLEDEIAHWQAEGVGLVVSLLEHHEVEELGLKDEAELCKLAGVAFLSFPITDRGLPENRRAALALADALAASDKDIAIHCRAGIGRSSLMAAAVMVARGLDAEVALAAIGQARGLAVPDTDAQRRWVLQLGLR